VRAGKASFDVREFSELSDALNGRPSGCRYHGACVPQLVIESDGSMYPCDFYVRPEYRLGSVYDTSLESSLESSGMAAFMADAAEGLDMCRTCPYLSVCRGMCRRMRDLLRPGTCPWVKIIDHITTQ
ncbi:MAG: SPASM domain-containing protein, partial [Clostridia bacterium]|nr:SPASM domain-containing protein [Clostridia bacterium]